MRQGRYGVVIEWLFRDRKTGRITIAQMPNLPLVLFLAASLLRWLVDPAGQVRAGLSLLATGALVWWAADELIRGVNPWRRLLGLAVLSGQALKYVA
jgi:hypothetical protein